MAVAERFNRPPAEYSRREEQEFRRRVEATLGRFDTSVRNQSFGGSTDVDVSAAGPNDTLRYSGVFNKWVSTSVLQTTDTGVLANGTLTVSGTAALQSTATVGTDPGVAGGAILRVGGGIKSALGTITTDQQGYWSTATWNNAGVLFVHNYIEVTSSNPGDGNPSTHLSGSRLLDVRLNGTSRFAIQVGGQFPSTVPFVSITPPTNFPGLAVFSNHTTTIGESSVIIQPTLNTTANPSLVHINAIDGGGAGTLTQLLRVGKSGGSFLSVLWNGESSIAGGASLDVVCKIGFGAVAPQAEEGVQINASLTNITGLSHYMLHVQGSGQASVSAYTTPIVYSARIGTYSKAANQTIGTWYGLYVQVGPVAGTKWSAWFEEDVNIDGSLVVGGTVTGGGLVAALDDLSDVTITAAATGHFLRYNGSLWVNTLLVAGDLPTHTHAAADITSGTFADALIAQSNVTQHQAALTIAETQITDGAILARVAANETVSGSWTFSSDVVFTAVPYVQGIAPFSVWIETDATADEKAWFHQVEGKLWRWGVANDAFSASASWMEVQRGTGNAITSITFPLGAVIIGTDPTGSELLRVTSARLNLLGVGVASQADRAIFVAHTNATDAYSYGLVAIPSQTGATSSGIGPIGGYFRADVNAPALTVDRAVAVFVETPTVTAGTLTFAFGIYIQPITTGGTNYAIYAAGAGRWYAGDQIQSAVTTGTAPFIVASTTLVTNLNADLLDGNEASAFALASHVHDAADITTGTFADARIAASNVTQHQAALTILETQITDGSLLARVAGTETISGAWTFNTAETTWTAGGIYLNGEGQAVTWDAGSLRRVGLVKQTGFFPEIRYLNSASLVFRRVTTGTILVPTASDAPLVLGTDGSVTVENLTTNDTITTTVTTGTAPLTVASTTLVTNLNADLLDGSHASAFAASSHTHAETDIVDGSILARVADTETISGAWTFTNAAGLTVSAATPILEWLDTDEVANEQKWHMSVAGKVFTFATKNAAESLTGQVFTVTRGSGTALTASTWLPPITFSGNATVNAQLSVTPSAGTALAVTQAVGSTGVVVSGGTQTTSQPAVTVTQTFNAAVTFRAFDIAITDTSSGTLSDAFRITVGGANRFEVRVKGGGSSIFNQSTINLQLNPNLSQEGLRIVGATVTANLPLINATQTWNSGAVAFMGIDLDITSTASASTSRLLRLQLSGNDRFSVDTAGTVYVQGTKVLSTRITGYTAMTGTADRGTSYATSTITLQQLAERVKALQDDATTHGWIGA